MIQFWSGGYKDKELCQLFLCLEEALNHAVNNNAEKIVIHDLQKVVEHIYNLCPSPDNHSD